MTGALDETKALQLRFDETGLIPAIVTDARDGALLMFAYMNREALDATLITGQVHFYSRSRKVLWKKGETSGETFAAISILTDCDQDVLQIKVSAEGHGAACHTGRKSCFYRKIVEGELEFIDNEKLFDPESVYGK
ncbi:MAG TPA: phosphoribosyl-AMP cyclohydrolase [Aestuariivirga sp.]|nr:phosphoribosyl-AMP cyclohydrolase [Aestuariivirga sp.]